MSSKYQNKPEAYAETLEWLFRQLPMYQHQGKAAFKKDLSNTLIFSEKLGSPEQKFKSVHVTGTNGKGSVSHMLASAFQEAGYKTGLYTSPHLKDFRERIKINGNKISQKNVINFIELHKKFIDQHHFSFFEMTVAMAFDYFAKEKVGIAIIEVGMGGRLDSTNIISPELSIITNIGKDHTQFLGNSLAEIAVEKAGIMKPNTPVVIGETHPETRPVFERTAHLKNAPIYFAEEHYFTNRVSDLKGHYQVKNKQTVQQAIQVLRKLGWKLSEENLKKGLQKVMRNTGLHGRWEVLQTQPKVICDTAHNPEGLRYVIKQLSEEKYNTLHLVLGMTNDKDPEIILSLFPKNARYYLCKPSIPRGMEIEHLQTAAIKLNLQTEAFVSVKKALEEALKNATQTDVIFVGGSSFVVAEAI